MSREVPTLDELYGPGASAAEGQALTEDTNEPPGRLSEDCKDGGWTRADVDPVSEPPVWDGLVEPTPGTRVHWFHSLDEADRCMSSMVVTEVIGGSIYGREDGAEYPTAVERSLLVPLCRVCETPVDDHQDQVRCCSVTGTADHRFVDGACECGEPCSCCGGEKTVFEDAWRYGGRNEGHYTIDRPCPECCGGDEPPDEPDPGDGEEW